MSSIGISGPHVFVNDPAEARFICEVLAEKAADSRAFTYKRSYQALRSLSPQELFDVFDHFRKTGNEGFREKFGPIYNRAAGAPAEGPLFGPQEATL